MQQLENELAQTQGNLEQATHNLEEKEKALQNVSGPFFVGNIDYFFASPEMSWWGVLIRISLLFHNVI